MEPIELDGRQHRVRHNLWQALFWLRYLDEPRILWIDAICINQSDIEERNQQVARMSQIYRCASQVIIWLGLPDERMQSAIIALRPIERKTILDLDLEAYLNIKHLLSQPYWTRLWIIQEIYHAHDIVIHCGILQLDWPPLHHFSIKIRIMISLSAEELSDKNDLEAVMKALYHCIAFPLCLNETRLCKPSTERSTMANKSALPLFDLCIKYDQAQCQDPRDKVYGLQSMAQVCCRAANPIDYSLPLPSISARVISHHMVTHAPQDISRYKWRENLVGSLAKFHWALQTVSENPPSFLARHSTLQPEENQAAETQDSRLDQVLVPTLASFSSRILYVWPLQKASDDTSVDDLVSLPVMSYDTVFRMQLILDKLSMLKARGLLQIIAGHLGSIVRFPRPFARCMLPENAPSNDSHHNPTNDTDPEEILAYCVDHVLRIARDIVALSAFVHDDFALGLTADGLYFVPTDSRVGDAILAFTRCPVFAVCRQVIGDSSNYEVYGRCIFLNNDSDADVADPCNPSIYVEFELSTLNLLTRAPSTPHPNTNKWPFSP